jgi:hypothetical protein
MAPGELGEIGYREQRRALLFGDCEAALARARRSLLSAGAGVAFEGPIDGAAGRLEAQVHADLVLVEVDGETPGLVPLLDRLESDVAAGRYRAVIAAPDTLIDLVFARIAHRDAALLCGAGEFERVATLALAAAAPKLRLNDSRQDNHAVLQQLSDEVARIAGMLSALAEEDGGGEALVAEAEDGSPIDSVMIRSIIRARRLRDRFFRGALFADPAWDMLLDLMAARLERNRVAVSSLCIAAAVPPTTALRWIKALTEKGIFVRCADPADGRRVYIELSDDAARALTAYLRAAQRIAPVGL